VTKSAGVKLLDFGLAKIERPVAVEQETMTMGLTIEGQILGTLLYRGAKTRSGRALASEGLVQHQYEGEDVATRTRLLPV